jgi:hypothetical protein
MHNTDTGTNKNITVANNSWSLIAYSANVSTNLSDINFVNSSGNSVNWSTAVSQSKVQAYLVYRENNVFKYVSTPEIPMQDTALRQNKGYWIKVRAMNGTANLSMPGVGGSLSGQTYEWSKLRFSNGTKDLNITEASGVNYNWTQANIYYYNTSINDYGNILGTPDPGIPEDKSTFSSWEGIFIWVKKNNINLIRRN